MGHVSLTDEMWTATEVSSFLRCAKSTAYKVMAKINKERKAQGLIVLQGRCPKKCVLERTGLA